MPEMTVADPATLQARVLAAIAAALGEDAPSIGVAVKDGCVVLMGEVPRPHMRAAALTAAFGVDGVTTVDDAIVLHPEVRTSARSDLDIARDVADVVAWAADSPDSVRARVADGRVVLTGTVRWDIEREAVSKSVRRVDGVIDVADRIRVVPPVEAAAPDPKEK
jgi:osmotically-inducible protein OsmY